MSTSISSLPIPRFLPRPLDVEMEASARAVGFTPLQARLLASRLPASARERIEAFAQPRLAYLDTPWSLPDIHVATNAIANAIIGGETLILLCDHDADGLTGCSILWSAMKDSFGVAPDRIVPLLSHRMKEGYGVSDALVDRLVSVCPAPALIITADQGSSDEARFARLVAMGYRICVTDHHEVPEAGPPASALACVNPSRKDSDFPDPHIAGCYVAWLTMAAVRQVLIDRSYLASDAPHLAHLLDLVAVGTTADASSFARSLNNRAVVQYGIHRINTAPRPAWQAMRQLLGKEGDFTDRDVSMAICPRLNARGRLGDMMLGAEFLLADDVENALRLAEVLEQENQKRKEIERAMVEAAIPIAHGQRDEAAIVVHLVDGHPGVHGIVASRLVESFGRPVVCLSPKQGMPGALTGSLRGVPGTHVRQALADVKRQYDAFPVTFGGHAMASGCLVMESDVDAFRTAFQAAIAAQVGEGADLSPVIHHDGPLGQVLCDDVMNEIEAIGPYGREFDAPTFCDTFYIFSARPVGDGRHLKLTLVSKDGERHGGIWFGAMEAGGEMPVQPGTSAQFLYSVSRNHFRGRCSLDLQIKKCVD